MIIKQSLDLAKRKANASGKIKFVKTTEKEKEDLNYELEWIKIVIQGTEKQEKEEYEDSMKLYGPLSKTFKKDFPTDTRMKKYFKTKVLNNEKLKDAYNKGYGAIGDNNVANKLLEMGILTHIELIKDYDTRQEEFTTDF